MLLGDYMAGKKKNCWEYMNCGREPEGSNIEELGICPAATAAMYNGINNGINGGRFCWLAVGTMSFAPILGTFAARMPTCLECPFFKEVKQQEGCVA
jgi:hypothetical protein